MALSKYTTAALEALHTYQSGKKKSNPCRIKYNGEFIVTLSGKTIWRTRAHCMSALRHHVKEIVERDGYRPGREMEVKRAMAEIMDQIEIIEVSEIISDFRQ